MNSIQVLHQKAMALAEQAEVAKLRGETPTTVQALLRSAFEQESAAAELPSTSKMMPNPRDRSSTEVPHPSRSTAENYKPQSD